MSAPLVISGELAERAQHRRRRDGMSVLTFEIALPSPLRDGAKPVTCRVTQEYGTSDAAAVACGNRAFHLHRGARVTVHAGACERRAARLDVSRVQGIEISAQAETRERYR